LSTLVADGRGPQMVAHRYRHDSHCIRNLRRILSTRRLPVFCIFCRITFDIFFQQWFRCSRVFCRFFVLYTRNDGSIFQKYLFFFFFCIWRHILVIIRNSGIELTLQSSASKVVTGRKSDLVIRCSEIRVKVQSTFDLGKSRGSIAIGGIGCGGADYFFIFLHDIVVFSHFFFTFREKSALYRFGFFSKLIWWFFSYLRFVLGDTAFHFSMTIYIYI